MPHNLRFCIRGLNSKSSNKKWHQGFCIYFWFFLHMLLFSYFSHHKRQKARRVYMWRPHRRWIRVPKRKKSFSDSNHREVFQKKSTYSSTGGSRLIRTRLIPFNSKIRNWTLSNVFKPHSAVSFYTLI